MRLKDKAIIVTGAASGMGKAMAELFAKEGGKVTVADLDFDNAKQVADGINSNGGTALAIKVDVSSLEDIQNMVSKTIESFGKLDALVNNAGIMDGMQPLGAVTDELWERIMNVNAKSVMMASREAISHFLENNGGVILNITSVGGLHGGRAGAAYTASKHAVVGLTKSSAYMYYERGIRTNAIAPGAIITNIASSMTNVDEYGYGRQSLGNAVMPRPGNAEEIAAAALFLISDEASYVNGVVMQVDGGWTAY